MVKNASLYMNADGKVALHYAGFSWMAAIGLPLWALHRQLYVACVALLPLTFALHRAMAWLIALSSDGAAITLLTCGWFIGWSVIAGRLANTAHRALLQRRGYFMTATELPMDGIRS